MNGYILDTAPTVEPISLAEAMIHLKIDDDSPSTNVEADFITALIKAARQWAEKFQNRVYITQTWSLYLDKFPSADYIEIPKPPLQYIVSMTYKDSAGSDQTVSFIDPSGTVLYETDEYIVDIARHPGRIYLKNSGSWPTALDEAQAVIIQFVAGYGNEDGGVLRPVPVAHRHERGPLLFGQ